MEGGTSREHQITSGGRGEGGGPTGVGSAGKVREAGKGACGERRRTVVGREWMVEGYGGESEREGQRVRV